jgi:hypothetical protein
MNPIFDAVSAAAGATLGKVFDRAAALIPPGEAEKQQMALQMRQEAVAEAQAEIRLALEEDQSLRGFMLSYEGASKDMPRGIQVLRASVRPILSYLLVTSTAWLVWNGRAIPTELHQLDLLCLAFWFGERAVTNYLRVKQGAPSTQGEEGQA